MYDDYIGAPNKWQGRNESTCFFELFVLAISATGIGAAGATALATALEHNDTLRNLSICNTSPKEPDFDCDRMSGMQ